jgi:hypothetical protein
VDDLYGTILDLPPRSKTILMFLIGFILIDDLTADQQIAMGNLFLMVGQALITNGTELRLVEVAEEQVTQQQLYNTIDDLKTRIETLESNTSNK